MKARAIAFELDWGFSVEKYWNVRRRIWPLDLQFAQEWPIALWDGGAVGGFKKILHWPCDSWRICRWMSRSSSCIPRLNGLSKRCRSLFATRGRTILGRGWSSLSYNHGECSVFRCRRGYVGRNFPWQSRRLVEGTRRISPLSILRRLDNVASWRRCPLRRATSGEEGRPC